MFARTQLAALVFLIAAMWALVLLVYGVPLSWAQLSRFSTIVGLVSLILLAFDRWAWRWRIFRQWLVTRPDIRGTWSLHLQSDWKNPETGSEVPPIAGFVAVHQTYATLNIRLMTEESTSDLIAAEIVEKKDDTCELVAIYINTPKATVRHRSEIHHGGMVLSIHGDPPHAIEGNYWTSRKTTGHMRLTERMPRIYTSLDDARAARGR